MAETYILENTSGAIESPDLWSQETPSLYLVKTTLVDPKSGKLLDEKKIIRWDFAGLPLMEVKVFSLMENLINYVDSIVIKIKLRQGSFR